MPAWNRICRCFGGAGASMFAVFRISAITSSGKLLWGRTDGASETTDRDGRNSDWPAFKALSTACPHPSVEAMSGHPHRQLSVMPLPRRAHGDRGSNAGWLKPQGLVHAGIPSCAAGGASRVRGLGMDMGQRDHRHPGNRHTKSGAVAQGGRAPKVCPVAGCSATGSTGETSMSGRATAPTSRNVTFCAPGWPASRSTPATGPSTRRQVTARDAHWTRGEQRTPTQ